MELKQKFDVGGMFQVNDGVVALILGSSYNENEKKFFYTIKFLVTSPKAKDGNFFRMNSNKNWSEPALEDKMTRSKWKYLKVE